MKNWWIFVFILMLGLVSAEVKSTDSVNIQTTGESNGNGDSLISPYSSNEVNFTIGSVLVEQGKLKSGDIEVNAEMEVTSTMEGNETKIMAKMSNGQNAEVKIMPETASQTAIERLSLKVCSSDNNCVIQLKEVGNAASKSLVYEVTAEKQAKLLWLINKKMEVKAQISVENGEVIRESKPWWAFMAQVE